VANRVFAIRLVQRLGWVFETQEKKKAKRKKDENTSNGAYITLSMYLPVLLFHSDNVSPSKVSKAQHP